MTEPKNVEIQEIRPRRRKWVFISLTVAAAPLIGLGFFLGIYLYRTSQADRQLEEAIAEADRLDPDWRFEELEQKRAAVPESENAASQVLAVKRLLPNLPWPGQRARASQRAGQDQPRDELPSVEDSLAALPRNVQLDKWQIQGIEAELRKAAPALAEARKLAAMPKGRYTVNWSLDTNSTLLPCQDAHEVANLLRFDVFFRAQNNDLDGALTSIRGELNTGRSIGDEPNIGSQLGRFGCQAMAIGCLERSLAQGQPSEEALKVLQQLLEDEAAQPLFLIAARGERGQRHREMEAVEAGDLTMSQMLSQMRGGTGKRTLSDALQDLTYAAMTKQWHAPSLRLLTEFVEIAKLPVHQQESRLRQLEANDLQLPVFAGLLIPSLTKVARAFQRSQAKLRTAVVALAAERYRRAHGHWPDSLDALLPKFLSTLPTDPYSGKALLYHRLDDMVVIYTVGPDRIDNGGEIDDEHPERPGTDIGFRLWNVDKRRQPPLPPIELDKPPADEELEPDMEVLPFPREDKRDVLLPAKKGQSSK